jgi:diaminopimelate epimerase
MKIDPVLKVFKMSGAGNTFALVDARAGSDFLAIEKNGLPSRKDWVPNLCDSRLGLGVDGVLILEEGRAGADYVWDFYNADGSGAEMCGNAARCAGLFCREKFGNKQKHEFVFLTGAGLVKVHADTSDVFTVEMTTGQIKSDHLNLLTEHGSIQGFWIDTGVPHFVVPVLEFRDLPLDVCRTLRRHQAFGAAGANVALLRAKSSTEADAVTYERGVENFTAACGTGAVAAALALGKAASGVFDVRMPGGDLRIKISEDRPMLSGPAIFLGEYLPSLETLI